MVKPFPALIGLCTQVKEGREGGRQIRYGRGDSGSLSSALEEHKDIQYCFTNGSLRIGTGRPYHTHRDITLAADKQAFLPAETLHLRMIPMNNFRSTTMYCTSPHLPRSSWSYVRYLADCQLPLYDCCK